MSAVIHVLPLFDSHLQQYSFFLEVRLHWGLKQFIAIVD